MGDNFEKLRFVFENDALRLKMREHFVLRIIYPWLFLFHLQNLVGFPQFLNIIQVAYSR